MLKENDRNMTGSLFYVGHEKITIINIDKIR